MSKKTWVAWVVLTFALFALFACFLSVRDVTYEELQTSDGQKYSQFDARLYVENELLSGVVPAHSDSDFVVLTFGKRNSFTAWRIFNGIYPSVSVGIHVAIFHDNESVTDQ